MTSANCLAIIVQIARIESMTHWRFGQTNSDAQADRRDQAMRPGQTNCPTQAERITLLRELGLCITDDGAIGMEFYLGR